jgi:histidinol-phosphate/aromatic aminotransferase/cobyric acid decarboxylase-like protein
VKAGSGFYSKSSSIAQARQHKQRNLNWRDKGQELARLRKKAASNQGLTVQQIAGGAGTLAVLMLVVILWASRQGKSPVVKHMQRREQILAASLAPTAPRTVRCLDPMRETQAEELDSCRRSHRRSGRTIRSETS